MMAPDGPLPLAGLPLRFSISFMRAAGKWRGFCTSEPQAIAWQCRGQRLNRVQRALMVAPRHCPWMRPHRPCRRSRNSVAPTPAQPPSWQQSEQSNPASALIGTAKK